MNFSTVKLCIHGTAWYRSCTRASYRYPNRFDIILLYLFGFCWFAVLFSIRISDHKMMFFLLFCPKNEINRWRICKQYGNRIQKKKRKNCHQPNSTQSVSQSVYCKRRNNNNRQTKENEDENTALWWISTVFSPMSHEPKSR